MYQLQDAQSQPIRSPKRCIASIAKACDHGMARCSECLTAGRGRRSVDRDTHGAELLAEEGRSSRLRPLEGCLGSTIQLLSLVLRLSPVGLILGEQQSTGARYCWRRSDIIGE